jgi:hypothetical protein
MFRTAILASAALALTTGCASIAHGRYQQIPINSNPSGASVAVNCGDGVQAGGATPTTVNLKRNANPCLVTVAKEGYEDAAVTFAKSVSGWVWGNLFFGGIPGWIIDGADGAIYNRVPDNVQVTLTKK